MNYTQAIDQVRDVVVKMRYLESIDNIIYCDKWHVCPKDGYVLVEVDSNVAIRVDKNMVMRDPSDIATPAK